MNIKYLSVQHVQIAPADIPSQADLASASIGALFAGIAIARSERGA